MAATSNGIYVSTNGSLWSRVLSNANGFSAITYGA
jgi:hypothetical protein